MQTISIIIPILNEQKYIKECLDSIVNSDFPKDAMEVLLIDGGSSDKTVTIIKEYQKIYPFIKLFYNPKKITPVSLNIGIKNAKNSYIIRVDAHSKYPKDYFSKLIKYHQKLEAQNVGGVIKTEVRNKTKTSLAIKAVLSDRYGVGSSFRVGVDAIKEVDTVPFGCYKREIFDKIGLYDERLVRNQDIELNKRLKKTDGKIYLVPEIKAIYFAREKFMELAKNNFANGKWNILTAYYTKSLNSLSLRHYIPLLFISILIILLFCCYKFAFLLFLAYFLFFAVRSAIIIKNTSLFHQIFAYIVLHFSYGVGEVAGVFKVLKMKFKDFING